MSKNHTAMNDELKRLQETPLAEHPDHQLLTHQREQLQQVRLRHIALRKQYIELYQTIQQTKNYQELVDTLHQQKTLLREIFTLEGALRRLDPQNRQGVELEWDKFGIDIAEYQQQNWKFANIK